MRKTLVIGLCASALTYGAWAHADGTTSCTDASSQGQIQRDAHKFVEARNQFILCAKKECPGVVRKDCTTWLEQVQASLPTVVPIATDEAGNTLANVKVLMDGKLLVEKIDGRAVEVNPGTYAFTFEAPDGTRAEKQVVVAEGEKDKRITATVAKPPEVSALAAPAPAPAPAPAAPAPAPVVLTETSSGPWKTIGIVTGAVGVVGIGLGSVFGVMASSKKGSAGCNSNSQCPNQGDVNTLSDAQSNGNVATGLFIAGSILTAGGIMIFALAPSSAVQVAPSVGTNAAGMLVKGVW